MRRLLMSIVFSVIFLVPLCAISRDDDILDRVPGPLRPITVEWIVIHGHLKQGETPQISPDSIHRGSELLWSNATDTPIRIKFGKGADCKKVSRVEFGSPSFQGTLWPRIAVKGCIITEEVIPPNNMLTMYPTEGGVFPYEIEFVGTGQKLTGTMKVI